MSKRYLLLLVTMPLLFGCEVRVRNSDASSGGLSGDSTTAVFSISRAQRDSLESYQITESRSTTTINTQVAEPTPASNRYEIITPLGNMTLRLYDATPAHRDNFKRLVEQGFYDGTAFHRVIANFVIQGGDPNSKDNDPYNDGQGGPGHTIASEFTPSLFHKKGAIAAARQDDQVNPERRSSGSQFYIVQGRPYGADELAEVESYVGQQIRDNNFRFSPQARNAYLTVGGIPTLDMQYTVFGEIVDGLNVLERISMSETDMLDRPKEDIPMTIRAVPAQ